MPQPHLIKQMMRDIGMGANTKARKLPATSSKILKRHKESNEHDKLFNYSCQAELPGEEYTTGHLLRDTPIRTVRRGSEIGALESHPSDRQKALERQENEKKKKYCKPCENQRRHFTGTIYTPFVLSTDVLYGFEARAFLKRLAKLLAEEWEKPYPTVRGFINARISIALVRATNRSIWH